jgi:hypothetical protein
MSDFNIREIIPVELDVKKINTVGLEAQTPDTVEFGNEKIYRVIHAISPEAKVQRVEGGAQFTVKDKDGTTQVMINDGRTGDTGEKGDKGDKGDPAAIVSQVTEYQVSESGMEIPSGAWSTEIPSVGQGYYLWTRQTLTWDDDNHTQTVHYSVSYQGLDGRGSVSYALVNGQQFFPDTDGGVNLGTVIRAHQDISGKADKVQNAVSGNFAGLDSNGNLTDSEKKAADFLASNQGAANAGKFMKVGANGALVPDTVPDPQTMTGATASAAGTGGLVPAPAAGEQGSVLQGDGTWGVRLSPDDIANNLTTTTEGKVLDARQGKALNDEIDSVSENTMKQRTAMSYVVDGDVSVDAIPAGAYFQLINSSITGRSDGEYTASKAIPANTAIDNTYFTQTAPISGGAVNALNSKIANSVRVVITTGSTSVPKNGWSEINWASDDVLCLGTLYGASHDSHAFWFSSNPTSRKFNIYNSYTSVASQSVSYMLAHFKLI